MIALLLFKKILSLFLIMGAGFVLVKTKVLKSEDSQAFSKISLYLVVPVVIVNAFMVKYTPEILHGFLLSSCAALFVLIFNVFFGKFLRHLLHLSPVEEASSEYSNAGNLIIPIVSYVLGPEWVLYTSPFICLQLIFMWTHAKSVICEEKGIDLKKILTNVNMIAIFIGILFFAFQIRLPSVVTDALDSIGSLLGPISMLIMGMLIGGMDLKKIFLNKRIYLICALRLIIVPLIPLLVMKFSGVSALHPEGEKILLISLLATVSPCAATVTQMAQVYGHDAYYASAVNVTSTILCIITMPLMIMLYQL